LGRLAPVLGFKPIKRATQWFIGKRVTGPDAAAREAGRMYLWGRVEDARGQGVTATFDTPEGYDLTAEASVEAARRVAAGEVGAGATTPSLAFGADFVEGLPGVTPMVVTTVVQGSS
jgi:saccharopine dehydrogenase (NAD+, L-lysine-forming)